MWFHWSDWSPCSKTCDHGTRHRVRTCQRPKHGGLACRGDNKQVMDCLQEPCYGNGDLVVKMVILIEYLMV